MREEDREFWTGSEDWRAFWSRMFTGGARPWATALLVLVGLFVIVQVVGLLLGADGDGLVFVIP